MTQIILEQVSIEPIFIIVEMVLLQISMILDFYHYKKHQLINKVISY